MEGDAIRCWKSQRRSVLYNLIPFQRILNHQYLTESRRFPLGDIHYRFRKTLPYQAETSYQYSVLEYLENLFVYNSYSLLYQGERIDYNRSSASVVGEVRSY